MIDRFKASTKEPLAAPRSASPTSALADKALAGAVLSRDEARAVLSAPAENTLALLDARSPPTGIGTAETSHRCSVRSCSPISGRR
jgi:hypothetical protein